MRMYSKYTYHCDDIVNPVQYDDTGRSMLELACAGSSALVVRQDENKKTPPRLYNNK